MLVNKTTLKKYLNKPYSFYYKGKKVFKIVFILFIMIFLFIYLLHPLNESYKQPRLNFFWISFLHSFIPVMVILLFSYLLKNSKTVKAWTIGKEIIFTLLVIFLSGILQFLIRDILYNNPLNWSFEYFFLELKKALVVLSFIRLAIIPLHLNRFQRENDEKTRLYKNKIIKEKETTSAVIDFETDVKSEKFSFNINDFVYAKSEGNYVDIYLEKDGAITKLTKRLAIKNLEERLKEFPFISKTHRSILLNLNAIEKVSGNTLGYRVKLKNCSETVPVSRKFIPSFNSKTKA